MATCSCTCFQNRVSGRFQSSISKGHFLQRNGELEKTCRTDLTCAHLHDRWRWCCSSPQLPAAVNVCLCLEIIHRPVPERREVENSEKIRLGIDHQGVITYEHSWSSASELKMCRSWGNQVVMKGQASLTREVCLVNLCHSKGGEKGWSSARELNCQTVWQSKMHGSPVAAQGTCINMQRCNISSFVLAWKRLCMMQLSRLGFQSSFDPRA